MAGYEWWTKAMEGEVIGGPSLPLHEGQPELGFYRKRTGKAGGYVGVAIFERDGSITAVENKVLVDAASVWVFCCKHPISEQAYRDWASTGKWWDQDDSVTASLGHNSGSEIDGIRDQIEAALKGVDEYAEVKDDETASKAQSLRSRLLELSRTADKAREKEKAPHLEAGKAVDAQYQPLVKSSKAGADKIASAISAHETRKYREEQARIAAEKARQAIEAAKYAPIGAEPEPIPEPAPAPMAAPIRGAYGRAAAVKTVKVAVVKDQDAAYAYFKAQPEVADTIQKLAQKAVTAGLSVPGVEIEEQRKIA